MKKILFLVAVAIGTVHAFSATTYTVSSSGTNSGTSWTTVRAAISAASSGDIVEVAAGTFTERNIILNTVKSLTIKGAGMNQTIIQADASTSITQANDCGVFKLDGAYTSGITITIQDMTIQNGYNSFSGGGIRFVNSGTQANAPTINLTNLKIASNRSPYGGGVYIQGAAAVTVDGCYITGNTMTNSSNNGGGIAVAPGAGFEANLTIKRSTISGNISTGNGGGVAIICGTNGANAAAVNSLWIENSTIYNNSCSTSAKYAAGIYFKTCLSSSGTNVAHTNNLTVNHTTIANNSTNAGTGGDGICFENSAGFATTFVMNNSIVIGNSGSTSNASQIGVNHSSISGNGKITNAGITNSIFGIIASGTWATTTTHNNLTATLGDLAFAGTLSSDATPVLKFSESSIARNYVASNLLSPALTTDQIGNERVGYTDAGAYEFPDYIISGTTNAADIVCTTCDVTVASGGELTVGATKTLKSVTVAAGGKITISAGTLTATNGITLQSSAAGTATMLNSGTYVGTINAEQYLGSARNWYVSSPVQTTNSPANNIARYYEYVETGNNNYPVDGSNNALNVGETSYWKFWSAGTSMTVGKGYIAQATSGTTVQFSGTPNNGNITTNFNLTRNDAYGKGFNLVGNPYPSYLDWSLVAGANPNLLSTAWFKTKKTTEFGGGYTFASVNVTTPSSPEIVSNNANTTITKYIPPTQAFWVRVKSGTASTSMSFTNAMREHRLDNGDLMKAPKVNERSRLRLQLVNGIESDETLIYFDNKATNDFNEYDSPKMMNYSSATPDLYSKAGAERLVINGMKEVAESMELPLGFSLNAAASLKLKATEMSNFPAGTRIYLLDKDESSQVELLPETEYNFSTTAATTNNESRFSLLFRSPGATTGIEKTEKGNTLVFVNTTNQITIIASEKSNYAIYNAVGQLIENGVINTKCDTRNTKQKAAGVYVVKVNNQSTRVIIK